MKRLHYKPAFKERVQPTLWQWILIQLGRRQHQYRYAADPGYVLLQTIDGNMSQIPRWKWEKTLRYRGLDRE